MLVPFLKVMASQSQHFQASKRVKVTSKQTSGQSQLLGSISGGYSGTLMSSQQFHAPQSPNLHATRLS